MPVSSSAAADGRHSAGGASARRGFDARIAEQQGAPLASWHVHDLRRSFATLAAEHELIEPHIIEAILNHVSGHRNGVAGVYNRATYREPKRIGLQRWADWLGAIVEGPSPQATSWRWRADARWSARENSARSGARSRTRWRGARCRRAGRAGSSIDAVQRLALLADASSVTPEQAAKLFRKLSG